MSNHLSAARHRTHLSPPLRIVIDFLRKGAVTSLAATELGFMGFLWILWLGQSHSSHSLVLFSPLLTPSPACAGNATSALMGLTISDCTILYDRKLPTYYSQQSIQH